MRELIDRIKERFTNLVNDLTRILQPRGRDMSIAPTHLDTKRVALSNVAETPVICEGVTTLRYVEFHALGGNSRISFTGAGCLSLDNYRTVTAGNVWTIRDVALQPLATDGTFCYALGEAVGVTLEIVWGK